MPAPRDPEGREVDHLTGAAFRLLRHGSRDWVEPARELSSRVPDADGQAFFNRGFGLGFALSLVQAEMGWQRAGYVESRIAAARAAVASALSVEEPAHAELLSFAMDCGLFYGAEGENERQSSLAKLDGLMDEVFGARREEDAGTVMTIDKPRASAPASVARGFPIGKGWIEGPVEGGTHAGIFNARPDGVAFIPLTGLPEHWQHRLYLWRQFTEAQAVPASDVNGTVKAHAALLGDEPPAELVLSHVDLPWGGNDVVVIIPLEPFTVDDWLRRFRAAGVRTPGLGEASPAKATPTRHGGPLLSVPGGPAGWLPDPSGRHEYRYWNGVTWTRHVSDKGSRAADPL